MGKFSGCFLVSDYDGTLTDDTGKIPQKNVDAIRYFMAGGGLFTVCTGRSAQGFQAFHPEWMNAPALVANGAMAYDYQNKKSLFSVGAGREAVQPLQAIAAQFENCCVELYNDKSEAFAYRMDERSKRHFERQNIRATEITDFSQVRFPVVKIMLGVGKEQCYEVQQYLKSLKMGDLRYIETYGDFIEIHHKAAGKDRGVLRLARDLGVLPEKVFCIGDGSNDTSMLKAAAIGFCPSDGDKFAKAAADIIVCSRSEGAVAGAVEYIEKMC